MKRLVLAASLLCLALDAAAACEPKNVLKIVTSLEMADAPAFATQPKTMYRTGRLYGRVEEMPNRESGLHLLFIVNGADIWMVNRADKTGEHAIDPGPSLRFRAPIVAHLTESEFWRQFEFGCEEPFMKAVNAAPQETPDGGRVYEHSKDGTTARLFMTKDGLPKRVEVRSADLQYAVLYQSFEEVKDPPKDLFEKPAGITFTERKE